MACSVPLVHVDGDLAGQQALGENPTSWLAAPSSGSTSDSVSSSTPTASTTTRAGRRRVTRNRAARGPGLLDADLSQAAVDLDLEGHRGRLPASGRPQPVATRRQRATRAPRRRGRSALARARRRAAPGMQERIATASTAMSSAVSGAATNGSPFRCASSSSRYVVWNSPRANSSVVEHPLEERDRRLDAAHLVLASSARRMPAMACSRVSPHALSFEIIES